MSATRNRPRVGYLVDVQNDFMHAALPGGRLYVKHLQDPDDVGAEQIIPTLERLARWMYQRCDVVILSGDWHGPEDAEIDATNPDFSATYPPHCMGPSTDAAERAGAELIAEVTPPRGSIVLPWDATPEIAARVAREAIDFKLPVFVQKTQFSVWTGNPAMDAFTTELTRALEARPEIILAGVASDVCDDQAIRGFLERGYPVTVVRDAIHSLGSQSDEAILAGWEALGAKTTTLAELEAAEPVTQSSAAGAR
jgi:nicotinamidase-related amidase